MATVKINNKEYNETDLSPDLIKYIVVRQEILNSKVRHLIEIEKIDVLSNYYNEKIEKLVGELESNTTVDKTETPENTVIGNVVTEPKKKFKKK